MITNILPLIIITVILVLFCPLFSSTVLAVPVAGPDKCSPDSSSEGSPGGYSKYSCCRTVTDGDKTYTECRTCETKNDKFECGDYKRQLETNMGNNAVILQEPLNEVHSNSDLDNNAGVLNEPSTKNITANRTLNSIGNTGNLENRNTKQDKSMEIVNNQLTDSGKKMEASNSQLQFPNMGSHNFQPGNTILDAPYQVKVQLDSITVHNDHDGFSRGKGEFVNYAYVQGHRLVINTHVDSGDTVYFKPDKHVTVFLERQIPISIFTVGNEEDCTARLERILPPQYLTELAQVFKDPKLDWSKAVSDTQSEIFNKYLTCDGNKLGTINRIHYPANYDQGTHSLSHSVKSSTGDFTLRYTVTVTSKQ